MFAQSNRSALFLRKEVNWGEVPVANTGNTWRAVRFTSESLDLDKKTTRSNVIRADRMNDALIYLGRNTSGDISGELSFGDWDGLMEGALGASWIVGGSTPSDATTQVPVTIAFDPGTRIGTLTLTGHAASSAGLNWIDYGVMANTILKIGNFVNASNNGNIYITAIAANVITFMASKGTVPTAEVLAHMAFHYEYLINGVVQPSFAVEKQFQDIGKYVYYNGLYVDTMSVDISSMDIVKIVFSFMGTDNVITVNTVTGDNVVLANHVLPTLSTNPITASVNVGALLVNGLPVSTGVKSLKFDTTNNLRIQDVIGSSTPGGVGSGSLDVKGTTEVYLQDMSLWQMILSHNNVSQFTSTKDSSGNEYAFSIPLSNFSKGSGKVGGKNQDVMLPLEFEASRDPLTNSQIVISRSTSVVAS